MAEPSHVPVMVEEVLEVLDPCPGAFVVDGTVGLGGHAERIAERLRPGGTLLGLDWDAEMLARAEKRLRAIPDVRWIFVHDDFRNLPRHVRGLPEPNGVLLDLGLNNAQIEDPARGISFRGEGPLDMRMDRSRGEPASALVNRLGEAELEAILRDYADERWARRIAREIVARRARRPLRTTTDLVECVLAAIPPRARERRLHPATRTFQALRIAVNRELEGLETALCDIARCLAEGGVLVVLSYHSGEDRSVKNAFRSLAESGFTLLFKRPRVPSEAEVAANPKSRSAKLRALRRCASG